MLGNKFAARLNSFASKPESFWSNKTVLNTIDLINRAATVRGLTDIDLNYPKEIFYGTAMEAVKRFPFNINVPKEKEKKKAIKYSLKRFIQY